ncbi:MAG: TPM domain-containing protein [Verrucomicrobiae bacterium]|nr:TPM domain-containing protein [Verrucomicrobiae bacterium]
MFPLRFPPAPVAVVALACLALPLLCLTGCSDNVTTVESQEKSAVSRTGEDPGSAELDPLPPAPESQILDDGRVFSHAPGELAQLAKYLKELKQNSGIEIFVAMYGFLDGETVEERANRLREAWANRNTGVVVVYESGGEGMSFVATDEIDAVLTRHDINTILQQAGQAAQEQKGAENQIQAAVHTLAESLVSKLDRRKAANALTSKKRILVVSTTLACVVLITLIGLLVTRFINRAERKDKEFYYFPNARVGTRYGAAFSGGTGAEIRFK